MSLRQSQPQLARWTDILSLDERERAEKFIVTRARDRFVGARAQMRRILAAYVEKDPAELRFDYGTFGKPLIAGGTDRRALEFNLSHSDDVGLLAVTSGEPVGVDVEQLQKEVEYEGAAEQLFSAEERGRLASLDDQQRVDTFFRYWTHKESVLKAIGCGFSIPPKACRVDLERGVATIDWSELALELRNWCVLSLSPADGYVAAVAMAVEPKKILLWDASLPH
jgi:4'-phosphopantetheinyl transferase